MSINNITLKKEKNKRIVLFAIASLELRGSLVDLSMLLEETAGNESPAAIRALIRPLARMVPKMQGQ